MIISLDAKEKIWHNPTLLDEKISGVSRDMGTYLHIIKVIYTKPTVNNILNEKKNFKYFQENQGQNKNVLSSHSCSIQHLKFSLNQ